VKAIAESISPPPRGLHRGLALGLIVLPSLLSASFLNPASAQGTPSANEIAQRVVNGSDAFRWDGGQSRVRMVLIEADGKRKERSMDVVARRKSGMFQSLVRFLAPGDIAGTAFLMLEKGKDEAEQYIYLPGIKRTRRIVGRERDGNFMGSDFTYADMQGANPSDAQHKRLPDEKVGNDPCYVIESTFDPKKSSYGKVAVWVRKTDYIALRTRFYDRAGKLVKTLYARRVKTIDGKQVVVEARMQTQGTNHATELFVDSLEKRADLSDAQFTPAALEHL
jgi:uncharacterized protein